MKVLACDGIHEDGLALFRDARWAVEISAPIKDPAALAKALDGVDALLVRSATSVTAESIEHASALRVIDRAGAGVDTIDVDAATNRGIAVSLGANGNGEALAAITVDREVAPAQLVALRGIPGVLELETL